MQYAARNTYLTTINADLTNHQTFETGGHIWHLKVSCALLGPSFPVQEVRGPLIALASNPSFISFIGVVGFTDTL